MTITADQAAEIRCDHCKGPMPVRAQGRPGRKARFCAQPCRQADNRLAIAAREARAALPGLREKLDRALDDARSAASRMHASALTEDELLMAPEPIHRAELAFSGAAERLRSFARAHREALETAARHRAGDPAQDDEY